MELTLADYLRQHPPELDEKSIALSETTAFTTYFERDLVLVKDMIQDGLSQLGTSGDGTKIVYLTLALNGLEVTDISVLSAFPDIQRLELSQNCIKDLSAVASLRHLTYLDVSFNRLTSILDTVNSTNLIEANYSHNEIEILGDLSHHNSLTILKLASNQITEITGLQNLSRLTQLDLSNNRIECITNLHGLPLKELNLSGNSIQKIDNIESLKFLQVLDLSSNQISSMDGLQGHMFLEHINLAENDIMDLVEIEHLTDLRMLRILNLKLNPVESLSDYQLSIVYKIPQLEKLDQIRLTPQIKVTAFNLFSPSLKVKAARDHMTNVTKLTQHPTWLKFSTLTSIDEPYPMLVLCGPRGSGKGYLSKRLVGDFPDFFGMGVSHTTRQIRKDEEQGNNYSFVSRDIFLKGIETGEFLETSSEDDELFGLSSMALEQVACQGLACVVHMNLQGVLSLKNTHFEPRYVLIMPYSPKIHKERLVDKGCYSGDEISKALQDAEAYKTVNREQPGFFDVAINADSLSESYQRLKVLVMAYGGITPDSTTSSRPATQFTSTSSDVSQEANNFTCPPPHGSPVLTGGNMAKTWSRPPSTKATSRNHSAATWHGSSGCVVSGGGRRHTQALAAVAGKESIPASRPSTRGTPRPTSELGSRPTQGIVQNDSSSEETASRDSAESFTRLYSARGFSPTSDKSESTGESPVHDTASN
ncbi:leucine-rich repeat and guanylate kinase domain-containing protein-like isoform X2 [Dysidea avara]|uniref:leucine-rich repeat and guanylate kinase domain-containing protein-like isoform X2 n=1 Tax=Dysidea avara TaxID=196820 RepID=UPI0033206049